MSQIRITALDNVLEFERLTSVTSNSLNVDRVEVALEERWRSLGQCEYGLSLEKVGGTVAEKGALTLTDEGSVLSCNLPVMVTAAPSTWLVGLFAKNQSGDKIKTSTLLSLTVERGANPDGDTSFATPKIKVEYYYREEIEQW